MISTNDLNLRKSGQSTKSETLPLKGLICFCFKHSKQSLFDSIQSNREEDIINDIKKKMKDSGCFCETSNPSGKCCMADVMGFIKQHKEIS